MKVKQEDEKAALELKKKKEEEARIRNREEQKYAFLTRLRQQQAKEAARLAEIAKQEAKARKKEQQRLQHEERQKQIAEEKQRKEAEAKIARENQERLRREKEARKLEEKARREAEELARREARREAEERDRREAEERAKNEAEELMRIEEQRLEAEKKAEKLEKKRLKKVRPGSSNSRNDSPSNSSIETEDERQYHSRYMEKHSNPIQPEIYQDTEMTPSVKQFFQKTLQTHERPPIHHNHMPKNYGITSPANQYMDSFEQQPKTSKLGIQLQPADPLSKPNVGNLWDRTKRPEQHLTMNPDPRPPVLPGWNNSTTEAFAMGVFGGKSPFTPNAADLPLLQQLSRKFDETEEMKYMALDEMKYMKLTDDHEDWRGSSSSSTTTGPPPGFQNFQQPGFQSGSYAWKGIYV